MIKRIFLALLILQVISKDITVRVSYPDEYVLNSPTTGKNITVKLHSTPTNNASVAINVQLRQIQDPASPLTSTQLDVQTCTFTNNTCKITFTTPTLNSAYKYTIRLAESTTLHQVVAYVDYTSSASNKGKKIQEGQGRVFLTPVGATDPGFKFVILNANANWSTNFTISSSPAPTVSSYNFNIYSVGSQNLTLVSTQAVTSGNSVSFTGLAVGTYYLSFDLTISSISATTQYPITLDFTFTEDHCTAGEYLDRKDRMCVLCSTLTNSGATQTKVGACECATNFYWNSQTSMCIACPSIGCPSHHNSKQTQSTQQKGSGAITLITNNNNNQGNLRH